MASSGKTPAWQLLGLMAGFVVWSVAFVALYGGFSVGCELGWHRVLLGPISLLRLLLIVGFVLTILALGFIAWWLRGWARQAGDTGGGFVATASYWLALIAFAAGLFTYAPVLFLGACGP